MKANYILTSILAAAVAFGSVSCAKEYEYEAAETVEGAGVFFAEADNLMDIHGGDGTIKVVLNRADKTDAVSVGVAATLDSLATGLFEVPSKVSFAAGKDAAELVITYDATKIAADTEYGIELTLLNDTTPYGTSSFAFVVSDITPINWVKWGEGTMTEGWWGEEEHEALYVNDLGEGQYYSYVENCFDTEGAATATNYYFYWNTKTNKILVPMQYMGYTNASGLKVYFGDINSFYYDYWGVDDSYYAGYGYENGPHYWFDLQGEKQSYYDGNGGFFFESWYYFAAADKKGSGYSFGDDEDVFIADGFVRINYDSSVDLDYKGTLTTAEAIYAQADLTVGASEDEDAVLAIDSVLVAVAAQADANATLSALAAGTADYAFSESGIINVAMPDSAATGTYYMIAMPFYEGAAVTSEYAAVKFSYAAAGSGSVPHVVSDYDDSAISVGIDTVTDVKGSWLYYSKTNKSTDARVFNGMVTIYDSATPNDGPDSYGCYDDYCMIKGLSGNIAAATGLNDAIEFDIYDGIFYNLKSAGLGACTLNGSTYYVMPYVYEANAGKLYNPSYAMIGGLVDETAIAFMCPSTNVAKGYNFCGYAFYAFTDDAYSTAAGIFGLFYDILLIDPSMAQFADKQMEVNPSSKLVELQNNLSLGRENFVESAKGYMKSQIDKVNAGKGEKVSFKNVVKEFKAAERL